MGFLHFGGGHSSQQIKLLSFGMVSAPSLQRGKTAVSPFISEAGIRASTLGIQSTT